ncbi:variable large family protein [Borrelia miyamotoi]|uniref:Variable large protein n=1 Tax=Borrelia miyamotoi TaxID=47466 RepID=A0A5P8AV71_9SPIR|nr:variable large family protein [Borrelia miyamotoi]WVI05447.1 variable large family protein [Borrelia miyamotoi]
MEKRSEIKNILIIMMIVLLMIGCGQQTEGNSAASGGVGSGLSGAMMEVGRSAENVFYAFMELVSDVLGFTAKIDTKKNDVGSYFNSLGVKLGEASKELEEVAKKTADSSKSQEIRGAVDAAKATLDTLKTNINLLGTIGDNNVVGYAASGGAGSGAAVAENELKKALKALQEIVKAATDAGVQALKEGTITLQVNGGADNKDGAKILATSGGNNPGANDAGKAAAILATVSGEEVLASIIASKESDAALTANASGDTTAVAFAKGGQADHLAGANTPKAAAVAGGIALRSLVKTGKLASGAADDATGGGKEVQGVGATAANKLLVAVEDVIKKTVKNVLEKAKTKIDEARNPKAAG